MPSTAEVPTLALWRSTFTELDRSPWPGPRPLQASDGPHLLVGREQEIVNFRHEVATYRLILLTGESGVGKTSLLEAGLVPSLRKSGLKVALCRDWSGSAEQTDPVAFLADKVRDAFEGTVDGLPLGAALFWTLNDVFREKCVLVLDQFEELIRDAEATLTRHLFRLLIEINRRTDLRVVISFRSEFRHKMADLEAGVQAFSMSHVALKQIDPDLVEKVILSANEGGESAITEEAAATVAELWQAASSDSYAPAAGGRTEIGLLHLQAVLYVLAARARPGTVRNEHVEALVKELDLGRENGHTAGLEPAGLSAGEATGLFTLGLEQAVKEKMRRCEQACTAIGLDSYLISGTSRCLVDAVRHLSSAGYKLVRDIYDLLSATLGTRLENLMRALAQSRADPSHEADGDLSEPERKLLLNVVLNMILPDRALPQVDLLSSSRLAIASLCGERRGDGLPGPSWAERLHEGATPDLADRFKVSCGPMLGFAPAAVLVEELRRFVFALEWLQRSSLLRISTPGSGGAMGALIHDGFGAALERWAREATASPRFELTALTSPQGGSFDWKTAGLSEPEWAEFDGTRTAGVLANLRWRGAWVHADFRKIMFVNCDLRGTIFDDCAFQGAVFVNCLLDGAMFTDCFVRGSPGPAERHPWNTEEPTFMVPAGTELVRTISRYRGEDTPGGQLLSQLPGLAAIPLRPGTTAGLDLEPETGGLVIFGGRISSLVIRSCDFSTDGTLSVRHSAGSGFDVVEASTGHFEFYGSSLRHISFSPSVALAGSDAAAARDVNLTIDINGSAVAQAWLSSGLRGRLTATDSVLMHIWNGSPGVAASAEKCPFHGLVGVSLDEGCEPLLSGESPVPVAALATVGNIQQQSRRMDYRSDPSKRQLGSADPEIPASPET